MTAPLRRKIARSRYSRTVWLGLAVAVAGYLEAQFRLIESLIPEQWRGVGMMAVGLAVVVLRFVTTLPVEELGPHDQDAPEDTDQPPA